MTVSKTYNLHRTQILPISRAVAWDFFSSPDNLGKITPPRMNFVIHSRTGGSHMFEGQEIHYRITVLPLIRVNWVTRITAVKEGISFTDEQLRGPYAIWRHTHLFRDVPGGTEMLDHVEYALPWSVLGTLAHALFVEREVNRIFDFRFRLLSSHFRNL